MNVKRIILTGEETAMEFPNRCTKWLVKNLSENDILVSFEAGGNENEKIKIPSNYGQVVEINEYVGGVYNPGRRMECERNTIYITGTGEVEVQQLCFI